MKDNKSPLKFLVNLLLLVQLHRPAQLLHQSYLEQFLQQRQYLVISGLDLLVLQIRPRLSVLCILHNGNYYLIQQIQMRMQYHKMKSNPFNSLKDRRSKQQIRSIDGCEQVQTLQNTDKPPSEERINTKYRTKSFVRGKDSSANLDIGGNISFKDLGKQLKSKRTLVQENEELKKKLETLMHNKSSRRGSTAKKLSTEFQKELYWNGSQSYMISGIKLQYQKMKDSYQKKSEDYEDLMRSAAVANNLEFMAYIQALEVENHILARQLQGATGSKVQIDDHALLVLQLKERNSRFESIINELKQKNRKKVTEIKKLKGKIAFLQKLVISKDNNEHLANKNMKKMQKQKKDLQGKVFQLEQKIRIMHKDHQSHVSKIQSFHKDNLELELNKQASSTKQQHENIFRLMRQNRYLQSLIDSWKAEKSPQKESKQHRQHYNNHHNSHHHYLQLKETLHPSKDHSSHGHYAQTTIDNKSVFKNSIQKDHHQPMHEKHPILKDEQQSQQQFPIREPYSADQKNSENSVKNRRVQIYQIQEIVDLSKHKLIALGRGVDWIIKQFEGNETDQWSKQYISMGQARSHLENQLQIGHQQALLLARYLIQHSNSQFVYTDDLNEYSRPVVKSILKSLYGNYSIYTNQKAEFLETLRNFKSKLEWMLESTTKGGVISRDKFNDLLQSLNINCKTGFDIFCISRMALKSQSMQKLQYKYLFEEVRLND